MADPRFLNPPLPPGSRFYPSEQQLICYYLASKNSNISRYGIDVIKEIDLYNFDPFDLPETGCFRFGKGARRRHWYCYVGRVDVERRRRAARNGYWESRGRGRDVVGEGAGRVVVGMRKSYVFYMSNGNKGSARRTDWVMYEYALIDHPKASFVLCRVLEKSDHRNNNICSCSRGEESFLSVSHKEVRHKSPVTVRHIGVQHDEAVTAEPKVWEDKSVDKEGEIHKAQQMEPFTDAAWGTMTVDDFRTQQLLAILEEDFIELDDLTRPLHEID